MVYFILATLVVAIHLGFIVFVVVGGLLVRRWGRVAWIHLPCVVWSIFVELAGRTCPLTPLENWVRRRAGEVGYTEGFMEHYLVAIVYPAGLTEDVQIALGVLALAVNLLAYGWLIWSRRRDKGDHRTVVN